MIGMSACLFGEKCRYEGKSQAEKLKTAIPRGAVIVPFCPEVAGGLGIPRTPAEIQGDSAEAVLAGTAQVVDQTGRDVTHEFLTGARACLREFKARGITEAIFKDGSPSCGTHRVYDGSFSGKQQAGRGVTCALLEANGIRCINENGE